MTFYPVCNGCKTCYDFDGKFTCYKCQQSIFLNDTLTLTVFYKPDILLEEKIYCSHCEENTIQEAVDGGMFCHTCDTYFGELPAKL